MLILGVVVSIFVFMFDFTPPSRLTKWVISIETFLMLLHPLTPFKPLFCVIILVL